MITWVRKPPRGEDLGARATGVGGLNRSANCQSAGKARCGCERAAHNRQGRLGKYSTKGATPFLMAPATADILT